MNEDRRAFCRISKFHKRLTGQEAFTVHGAGGNEANAFPVLVLNRITAMCHAHTLFIEAEANHHTLAFLLACDISLTANEPRLAHFDVWTRFALGHAQI